MVIVLLLVQIAFLVLFFTASTEASTIMQISLRLISYAVALYIISRKGKAANKLTWIVIIFAFPIFGGILYLWIRLQYSTRFVRLLNHYSNEQDYIIKPAEKALIPASELYPQNESLMRYLQGHVAFPVYRNTSAKYFGSGEEFYESLLCELEKAEKYIFLEFFIVSEGEMLDSIVEILRRKTAAGVEVRVMYDDIGCFLTLPRDYAKVLREMGINCRVFNTFRPVLSAIQNNRDHRKIVSIDGKVAFTGGINIADEYINRIEKYGHWRDAGIMLSGDAAWSFTVMFLRVWDSMSRRPENFSAFLPPVFKRDIALDNQFVQPYCDSPMDKENVGEHVYMNIINNAKKYLYISTPYLIIDDSMISALTLAAKSGVDVRIMTPQRWDKVFVHMTSRSYYRDLLDAGVKIYEYTNGFNHAKTFVSDDCVATVGTTNLDFRSLYLHFECGVCLYGASAVADIRDDFERTLERCTEITPSDCKNSAFIRFIQEVLRIFAPLM